jgi:hypothetical protein
MTREELEETVASTICCHTRMSPAVQWEIDLLMGAIDKHTARLRERAEKAEARIQALTEATILWRDRPGGDIGLAIALSSILNTDKPEPPAATAVIRALRECDRIEAAVHANPQHPDFDGAYLACIGHIRTALNPPTELRSNASYPSDRDGA